MWLSRSPDLVKPLLLHSMCHLDCLPLQQRQAASEHFALNNVVEIVEIDEEDEILGVTPTPITTISASAVALTARFPMPVQTLPLVALL